MTSQQSNKKPNWLIALQRDLWKNPDRFMAIKVSVAMALLVIPFIFLQKPYCSVTLALGVVAAGLAETDDHPRGRLKAIIVTILVFAITTISVSILKPFPFWFGAGFILSTIVYVIIGGISERYRGISYGAILIGIYAMLGYQEGTPWYLMPVLLSSGALFYAIISLFILWRKPYRLLEEQLSRGFLALSDYLEEKARLFPYNEHNETEVGHRLAILNVAVVNALEKSKAVLNSYGQEVRDQKELLPYLQRFMLLQSLHERAASSHERYETLGEKVGCGEILEGFGELLLQLSFATRLVSENMLTGQVYKHPVSIAWIITALESEIEVIPPEDQQLLVLLLHNLTRSHLSLQNLDKPEESESIPRLAQDSRTVWERIKDLLSFKHPRLRYAIRLSSCFLIGYLLVHYFNLEKGEWVILTSLFVNQPTYSETRRRLFQRVLGTISGVVIGVAIIQLLPTITGQMLLMILATYGFFYWKISNYSFAVVFITIYVLCSNNLSAGSGVADMAPRILDTVIGALLAILAIRLLWPGWQHRKLPHLLSQALKNNASYFKTILLEYEGSVPKDDDLEYRIARREAHKADNELTLSWQSMRLEPKKQQKFMKFAFTFTYLNHALLSYLSALGARRGAGATMFKDFESYSAQIEQALLEVGGMLEEKGKNPIQVNLKPILLQLKERIDSTADQQERQQLRLLYNVAGVGNKLVKQSEALRKESN